MIIEDWSDIAGRFTDGLVLGNGASIAFDPRFGYPSLRARAENDGLITADVRRVFEHLRTVDFELVLRMLWHASMINQALGVDEPRTAAAYESVRDALIAVVREIHVGYEGVADRLGLAAAFMSRFRTVASLSYDVLVYWALLAGNEADPTHRFKDCFVDGGRFRQDWRPLRDPIPPHTRSTLVVYPHGSLALASDLTGAECKLTAGGANLLETIFASWESGEWSPVFVSEGTAEQKMASIRRSPYLSTVVGEVLPSMDESVVLFGWSLGENDLHLLDAICRGRASRYAVAVDPDLAEPEHDFLEARTNQLLAQRVNRPEVVFFDRSSAGCWLAP